MKSGKLLLYSRQVVLAVLVSVAATTVLAAADSERITSFISDIEVFADGSMIVTETIEAISTGDKIKRGIYRDFPTRYEDRAGHDYVVDFRVREVRRDGAAESYHTEDLSNGVRVYIGKADHYLEPGRHTFELSYRTDRQIGFFDDHDELYWNVTGSGWDFVIERAEVVVRLPQQPQILDMSAYTGMVGGAGQDYERGLDENGNPWFMTTAPVRPGQDFTIAVSWPKGIVTEPSFAENLQWTLARNLSTLAALVGIIIISIYYLAVWSRVGKDPDKGVIIPRFEPPKNLSPAATRFVMRMGYDNRAFAAAIVNMAVKGYVTIEQDDKDYVLHKTGDNAESLSMGEKRIAAKLFAVGTSIELTKTNHKRIGKATKALQKMLKAEFEITYFRTNSKYLIPGIVLMLLTLLGLAATGSQPSLALFMCAWLSGWSIGVFLLGAAVYSSWTSGSKLAAIPITLFAMPFFGGELVGLWALATATSFAAAFLFLVLIAETVLFYQLLKAPTFTGRRVMDEIEGFKMFLTTTEEDRLEKMYPADTLPQVFETFFPYAMALGVEKQWSDKLALLLERVGRDPETYSPPWYRGTTYAGHGIAGLATGLGSSLTGAVASSSTAPGSSSGSGGGGSSGGGGGGGGGGGW